MLHSEDLNKHFHQDIHKLSKRSRAGRLLPVELDHQQVAVQRQLGRLGQRSELDSNEQLLFVHDES